MTQQGNSDIISPRSQAFAEDFVVVPDTLTRARQSAVGLGVPAPSQGTLTAIKFLAKLINAKAVVEIGTGTGGVGLALFEGMDPQGVLTSIDPEAQLQTEARANLQAAGIRNQRFRLITGTPLDVLPKLREGAYDLVVVAGDKLEYVEYVAQSLRLLRHGGVMVLLDALWHNKVADPANEDDETVIIRESLQSVLETEEFTTSLLPVGNGLLVAMKA